jgi:Na+/H+ antiporter NhaB
MAEMIDIFLSQYNSVKFNLYFQFLSTFLGTILMKGIVIAVLIGLALSLMVGRVSHSQQSHQDSQLEQALREARKVSAELAEKVRGLLLQEIERGGLVNAARVCSELPKKLLNSSIKGQGIMPVV